MWNLESLDYLTDHHNFQMKNLLKEFKNRPKIEDAKQENLYLMKLKQKIEDKYLSYEKRVLESNVLKMSACTANIYSHIFIHNLYPV